jgi:hypothetical protein
LEGFSLIFNIEIGILIIFVLPLFGIIVAILFGAEIYSLFGLGLIACIPEVYACVFDSVAEGLLHAKAVLLSELLQ